MNALTVLEPGPCLTVQDAGREGYQHIGIAPAHCLYVGDDLRDIQAANAAGMRGVAVRWGYLGDGLPPEQWDADALIDQPQQLLALLDQPANRSNAD